MAELQLVGFKQGREEYVVDIIKVKEIIKMPDITQVPEARSYVEGVINLRGTVIPVVNLKQRLGISNMSDNNNDRKVIVIEHEGKLTGFTVDSVTEVITLDSRKIDPTPELVSNVDKAHIKGIGKLSDNRLLIILDIEKILEDTEIGY